jgi:ribonuclease P protein component
MGEQSFPKKYRLTRTYEYGQVYRTGKRFPSARFLLFTRPGAHEFSRVGLSVGKKVGKAVTRNRVKRRLREIMRIRRPHFIRPTDIVLVAHPKAAGLTYAEMEGEVDKLLRKAGLL